MSCAVLTESFRSAADTANAVLTTAVDTGGRPWTPRCPDTSSGVLMWPAVDSRGLGNPSEKRKVDSSILSLTTRSNQAILLFTCGNVIGGYTWPLPARARPGLSKTGRGRPLVHVGGTAHQQAYSRYDSSAGHLAGLED
jgi:hypothetical protein